MIRVINRHYNPDNDGLYSLFFALVGPVVTLLGARAVEGSGAGTAIAFAMANVLYISHAVIALLFATAVFLRDPEEKPEGTPFAALIGFFLTAASLFTIIVLGPLIAQAREGAYRSCSQTLKQWGLVHRMYASGQDQERYPPLSSVPGQLMMDIGTVYPEYLNDLSMMQCHTLRDARLALAHDNPLFGVVSDQSYFYLGYIIDRPETLRAFQVAYEKTIAEGGDFKSDLVVPSGQGTWGGDTILRLTDYREALLLTDEASNSERENQLAHEIPIMIEPPGRHPARGGSSKNFGQVLYMDGHVNALPYPGEWPMTEEFMAVLQHLDQMGPHIPEGTFDAPQNSAGLVLVAIGIGLGGLIFLLWRFGRYPAVTVPLLYLLLGVGLSLAVTLAPDRCPALTGNLLPIAGPDGEVVYHTIETSGGQRSR